LEEKSSKNKIKMEKKEKIIVALDVKTMNDALTLVDLLKNDVGYFKVGKEILNAVGLPIVVGQLKALGAKVFVDIKESDIPNTVGEAVAAATRAGADIINVHATGGLEMMQAAVKKGKTANPNVKIIAVSILTSLSDKDMREIGFVYPAKAMVYHLANLAKQAGMDGLVCSPQEVAGVREIMGPDALLITPGIRPQWDQKAGDQKRIATPMDAILNGASAMVIGRSITKNSQFSPVQAAEKIANEICQALAAQTAENGRTPKSIKDDFVNLLLEADVVKIKEEAFTLKAGGKSHMYVNARDLPANPNAFGTALYHLRSLIEQKGISADRIAGVPMGGLSFAANLSQQLGIPLLTLRDKPKDHGEVGKQTVESFESGQSVLLFEDVATTGTSTLETIERLKEIGLNVSDVVVLVNRNSGAKKALADKGIILHSVLRFDDIINAVLRSESISEAIKQIVRDEIEFCN
jgi:orotidine-5'-phosphate decarboxylase